MCDGLAADDFRGATQHALANTALTITYLEAGAKNRLETPDDAYRLGVLYFRQGSLYAVRLNDHKTAVAWYEKAFPFLDRPIPLTRRNEQGRYGEWLVSMGLSYWEVGQRDFAMQLTDAGMQHVQEAVDRKLVDPKVLAVPYGNLAAMHKASATKTKPTTMPNSPRRAKHSVQLSDSWGKRYRAISEPAHQSVRASMRAQAIFSLIAVILGVCTAARCTWSGRSGIGQYPKAMIRRSSSIGDWYRRDRSAARRFAQNLGRAAANDR